MLFFPDLSIIDSGIVVNKTGADTFKVTALFGKRMQSTVKVHINAYR